MRFNRLDLTRFGPFTEKSFDFSTPGIQLIVGNNEAGKTVSMSAIRELLFGIPTRTVFDFVHKMPDLCLGAQLEDESGAVHEIVRVKRRTGTLRDSEGNVLDEAVLSRLLHGIDEAVYASLFTVGHDEIAAGGAALLDSDGEVGRALFSASRGTTDLTAVLRELDRRADGLFKQRSTNPSLNAAIRGFKDVSAAAAQESKSASEVVELDEALTAARQEHDELAAKRRDLAARRTLLERVARTRGFLANQHVFVGKLAELGGEGPRVDEEVGLRLEEIRLLRESNRSALLAAESAIERLDSKLGDLSFDSRLLEQQDVVEKLTRESGGYDQNEKDLPGLRVKANTHKQELGQLRKRLPAGSSPVVEEGTRLAVNDEQRIEELAAKHSDLNNDLRHASQAVEETQCLLERLRGELENLGELTDAAALTDVLARVRKDGDLESIRADRIRDLGVLDRALVGELATLGLTGVDVRSIDSVVAPMIETIRQARSEWEGRDRGITRLLEKIGELEFLKDGVGTELAQLLRTEEPPTTEDLLTARSKRDRGWNLIRRTWLEGLDGGDVESAWTDGRPLQEAYEAAVGDADEVADRLRREASAVEQRVMLEQQLQASAKDITRLTADLESERAEGELSKAAWAGLWQPLGIASQTPAEMEAWHNRYKASAGRSEESRVAAAKVLDLETSIDRHCSDIVASLAAVGESFPEGLSLLGLLDHAEKIVADAAAAQQQQTDVSTAVRKEETLFEKRMIIHERSDSAMVDWQAAWSEEMMLLGLKPTASTGEAESILGIFRDIFENEAALEDLKRRIYGITKRSDEFADGVTAVLTILETDDGFAEADPLTNVRMLDRKVKEASAIQTKNRAIVEERNNQADERDDASTGLAEASNSINDLVKAAGVASESDLSLAISRSNEYTKVLEEIRAGENRLREVAGKPLDEIEAEVAALAGAEIEPEIQEIDLELEALDSQIKGKQTKVGELTNQRSLIGSSQDAADLMTQAEQSLASISDYADEYVQVMLARRLLEEHVTAYRDENQGPLLERASELFSSLTLERYVGLDTDTDNKGNPFLLARHADEKLLKVDALSTGTRDQLYLALRLAALEHFMDRRGPLPIVFDDLFVQFDDGRTEAGLEMLDALAHKTQVLLFTHHSEVARQASRVIDPDRMTLHSLG